MTEKSVKRTERRTQKKNSENPPKKRAKKQCEICDEIVSGNNLYNYKLSHAPPKL